MFIQDFIKIILENNKACRGEALTSQFVDTYHKIDNNRIVNSFVVNRRNKSRKYKLTRISSNTIKQIICTEPVQFQFMKDCEILFLTKSITVVLFFVADDIDSITCYCMKPFANRPMIECDECQLWIHLSCAKIRRTNIPKNFVCQPCRDAKYTVRKSDRQRTIKKR